MKSFKLILSVIFLFCSKENIAQLDSVNTIQLNEIIITATKSEKLIDDTTIPTISISNKEISSSGYTSLGEIIAEQTGMTIMPTYSGGESVQLQGLDSDYVLILIDGFPITGRVAGDLDISRLSLYDVEKIEIIKGGSSSLYGSEAMAGVINVVTKKNYKEGLFPGISYKYGSHDLHDISANIFFSKNNIKAGGNLNYISSSGYDLIDTDDTQTVQPFNRITNSVFIKTSQKKLGNIEVKARNYIENKDETVFITQSGSRAKSKINEYNIYFKYKNKLHKETSLFFEYYNTLYGNEESLLVNDIFQYYEFNQSVKRYELRLNNNDIRNLNIDIGIGINKEFVDRTNFEEKENLKSEYLYIQNDWKLNNNINIVSGLRYDRHREYKSQISPKFSINKKFSDKITFKASIGTGFKTPDFRHLYLNFSNTSSGYIVLGSNILEKTIKNLRESMQLLDYSGPDNSILSPEKSISLNIGINSYLMPTIPFEINFFRNGIDNLIDTRVVGQKTNGQTIFSYFNIKKAHTYGIEFSSTILVSDFFKIKLSNYHLYAKDISALKDFKNGIVFSRDKNTMQSFMLSNKDYFGLFNRARNQLNFRTNYEIKNLRTNLIFNLIHKTKIGFRDTNGNTYLDKYDNFSKGHVIANITIDKKILKMLRAQLIIKNILNYIDPINYINNPGRSFYTRIIFGR